MALVVPPLNRAWGMVAPATAMVNKVPEQVEAPVNKVPEQVEALVNRVQGMMALVVLLLDRVRGRIALAIKMLKQAPVRAQRTVCSSKKIIQRIMSQFPLESAALIPICTGLRCI